MPPPPYSLSMRMARVADAFRDGQGMAAKGASPEDVLDGIRESGHALLNVLTEGASAALALPGLQRDGSVGEPWMRFSHLAGAAFAVPVHLGLGWAASEAGAVGAVPIAVAEEHQQAVADGIGYREGLLRMASTVRRQQLPVELPTMLLPAFDHGLGRSLWYTSQGDITRLCALLHYFPEGRKPALWRGIGTAAAFVAGLDSTTAMALRNAASGFSKELMEGAGAVSQSLRTYGMGEEEAEAVSRMLCPNAA